MTTLHTALNRLNEIGAHINRIGSDEGLTLRQTLSLIAESASHFVPGSIALITTYDTSTASFDAASRVSAGEGSAALAAISPRPGGLGHTAVARRQPIVSYAPDGPDMHPDLRAAGVRAAACFPLIVAERIVGALYIYLMADRRFAEAELLMLGNVANLAAMAITHTRRIEQAQAELTRREEEIMRLRRAGLLISSRSGLGSTLEAILQMALEITGAQYGIFRLVKAHMLDTAAFAGEGLTAPVIESLPLDENSIMGWVALHRVPLVIADLHQPPWDARYTPLDEQTPMRSEVAVPLIGSGGRLEGVLNLESPRPYAFSERDSLLLQALATQAVIAIQEARLLDALQDVTAWLLAHPLDHTLKELTALAHTLLGVSEARIVVGPPPGSAPPPLHAAYTGAQAAHHAGLLAVPLLHPQGGAPLGVFSARVGTGDIERDKKVLALLAHYAALAIQNADRQEELRHAHARRAVAETFAALGDIAANLLHQLNNKIGTIPVRVEGIQMKSSAHVEADTYLAANLSEIEASAREAMTIVRENMALLRPLRPTPISIASCVAQALVEVGPPPGVTVEQRGLEGLPRVLGTSQSVKLVFVNLIENATHAMGGQGTQRLTISGEAAAGAVTVSVSDTGPGIPPDMTERIFELEVSGGAVNHAGKLGFGLWWVRTLLARLGGTIRVENNPAGGACFRLSLPRADEGRPQ